jgi:hypothetical protein
MHRTISSAAPIVAGGAANLLTGLSRGETSGQRRPAHQARKDLARDIRQDTTEEEDYGREREEARTEGTAVLIEPYKARTFRFHGVQPQDGWRLKLYSISHDGSSLKWNEFEEAIRLALVALPTPPVASGRLGVGFLIAHHGKTGDYLILAWWDLENELPLRVFVRPRKGGARWRPARESESICVWDLEILWSEREAYVDTILSGEGLSAKEKYLERFMNDAIAAERP